jgi:hypothetical protein
MIKDFLSGKVLFICFLQITSFPNVYIYNDISRIYVNKLPNALYFSGTSIQEAYMRKLSQTARKAQ